MLAAPETTIQMNGITATFEARADGYFLRSLSNQTGVTASITIPLVDNRTTQYTLRPFQKMVVYPPVGVESFFTERIF